MLFEVTTDTWLLRLKGPNRATVLTGETTTPPPVSLSTTGGVDRLRELTVDDATVPLAGTVFTGSGPALFEQTAYRLTVENRAGQPVTIKHLDPTLLSDVEPVPDRPSIVTGSINFRSQVGETVFTVSDPTGSALTVKVEVRPSKLDYEEDFVDLIDAVNDFARQLTFEFLQATSVGGDTNPEEAATTTDWLVTLRHEIDNLDRALRHIASNPHVQLVRDITHQPANRIRRATTVTRNAVARGQGEGPWENSPLAARHRARLPAIQPTETTDTPEHRWLRNQLATITTRLAEVEAQHRAPRRRGVPDSTPSPRQHAIATELAGFRTRLTAYITVEPFASASVGWDAAPTSMVFQQRPGYREANQVLSRINRATNVHGDALNLPLRDLSDLYEIWCFLAVVRLIAELTGNPVELDNVIHVDDQGSRFTVKKGKRSRVRFPYRGGTVDVVYNPTYKTATGPQKPDIVIEVTRPGEPSILLVIDAKYRVRADDKYVYEYKSPGPPVDAIEQLHRYRDAVTVNDGTDDWRSVTRAVAAFPLSVANDDEWTTHRFHESIGSVGVGGIPFLPSNMNHMRTWIRRALWTPRVDLAWPGPLFLAWEQVRDTYKATGNADEPLDFDGFDENDSQSD